MKNYIIAIWVTAVITISVNLGQSPAVDFLLTVETAPACGGDDADDD